MNKKSISWCHISFPRVKLYVFAKILRQSVFKNKNDCMLWTIIWKNDQTLIYFVIKIIFAYHGLRFQNNRFFFSINYKNFHWFFFNLDMNFFRFLNFKKIISRTQLKKENIFLVLLFITVDKNWNIDKNYVKISELFVYFLGNNWPP